VQIAGVAAQQPASYRLFEMLPLMPRFTVEQARQKLLEGLGVLAQRTGQKTNRIYSYERYVALLRR
jgi:hypothetical protein